MDYSSLSRSQLISLLEQPQRAKPTTLPLRGAPKTNGVDIYNGTPTTEDLGKINHLASMEGAQSDWRVFSFLASDNFLNYNYRRWSLGVLDQMFSRYAGVNLILDHNSERVESSVGFVFEAQRYSDESPSDEIIHASVFGEQNKKIADDESYQWLLLKAAVEADSPFAKAADFRRAQGCSTSFWLYDPRTICPDCSAKHGREVEFEEVEVRTTDKSSSVVNICPHTPLSLLNLSMWAYYGDGSEQNWSSYVVKDGRVDVSELSSCVDGALPATGIIR